MGKYDTALKSLIASGGGELFRQLGIGPIRRWLNVELPMVRNPRVDLLGEADDGEVKHLELQRENDAAMPLRMAEYAIAIFRREKRYPRQFVLYVGEAPMGMANRLDELGMSFWYTMMDVRDLDGDTLSGSPEVSDKILALLAGTSNPPEVIRSIVRKLPTMSSREQESAWSSLLITSKLRTGLTDEVRKGANMLQDMEPELARELNAFYREQGRQEGLEEGLQEERKRLTRAILEKRFGRLPNWAEAKFNCLSPVDLENLALSAWDAATLHEALG